jgi:hypothetical protein
VPSRTGGLRMKCEPKREELKAKWRKPHNEKLRVLRSSPIINKSMGMRWAGKIRRMGRNRKFFPPVLVGLPEGN